MYINLVSRMLLNFVDFINAKLGHLLVRVNLLSLPTKRNGALMLPGL